MELMENMGLKLNGIVRKKALSRFVGDDDPLPLSEKTSYKRNPAPAPMTLCHQYRWVGKMGGCTFVLSIKMIA